MNTYELLTGERRQKAYVIYALVGALIGTANIFATSPLVGDFGPQLQQIADTAMKVFVYLCVTFGLVAGNNVQVDDTPAITDGPEDSEVTEDEGSDEPGLDGPELESDDVEPTSDDEVPQG